MTTVEQVAEEIGVPVATVLRTAAELGMVASSAESGLSGAEHRSLRVALGAPSDLPPVAAGSRRRDPGAADVDADRRSLRERHDALVRETTRPKRKLNVRTLTRATIGLCLVVAVGAGVASLGNWNEGSVEDVVRFSAADVGTCVDFDDDFKGGLAVLACELPHDAELFGIVTSDGGPDGGTGSGPDAPFPGAEALRLEAEQRCSPQFTDYVGLGADEVAQVDMVFLLPTADTWPVGDRTIHCLLEAPGNKLAESWRDAGR